MLQYQHWLVSFATPNRKLHRDYLATVPYDPLRDACATIKYLKLDDVCSLEVLVNKYGLYKQQEVRFVAIISLDEVVLVLFGQLLLELVKALPNYSLFGLGNQF